MARRVALDPELVVYDEPFSGLEALRHKERPNRMAKNVAGQPIHPIDRGQTGAPDCFENLFTISQGVAQRSLQDGPNAVR